MTSKSYMDHVKPYRPLVERYAPVAEMDRAGEISWRVLAGCPEEGIEADTRVAARAYELVNSEQQLGARTERQAVNALLHTAAFLVAERETERGKPFNDKELGDMMLDVLPIVFQAKDELQRYEREGKRATMTR